MCGAHMLGAVFIRAPSDSEVTRVFVQNLRIFTAGLTGFLGNRSKPLMEPLDSESIAIVNGSLIIVVDQDGQIQKTISSLPPTHILVH